MQTNIATELRSTPNGQTADEILRSCVHCGFCTATCPTYQLLGNELDAPRGRIYLIKEMLENNRATAVTQEHLDRCLTCRSCETTCPSGVQYSHLLSLGREMAETLVERPVAYKIKRKLILMVLPYQNRFLLLIRTLKLFKPLLSRRLKKQLPSPASKNNFPVASPQKRSVLLFEACVQPGLAADTTPATEAVLNHLGVSVRRISNQQCCGAVAHHLNDLENSRLQMRNNIDAWWPLIHSGTAPPEAIVATASACALELKEYGHLLRHDAEYAEKAAHISSITRDISEIVASAELDNIRLSKPKRVAFHPPCTLQHGQKLSGVVEKVLTTIGYELTHIPDSHLCCGSAGTYSLLQPKISDQLRSNKLESINSGKPDIIATANVGCQVHLKGDAETPVVHWIEMLADDILDE